MSHFLWVMSDSLGPSLRYSQWLECCFLPDAFAAVSLENLALWFPSVWSLLVYIPSFFYLCTKLNSCGRAEAFLCF